MNRRTFLKRFAVSGLFAAGIQQMPAAQNPCRPNILWIISEDTSPDFACYGNTDVNTPAFDKLAAEGMRCTNAFATAPICSPSRSALMTGMYQTAIGAHPHRSPEGARRPLSEPVAIITEYFRRAGYFIAYAGKKDFNFKFDRFWDDTVWNARRPGQPFFAVHNLSLTHRPFKRDAQHPVDPVALTSLPPYYPDHPLVWRDWADYLESLQLLDGQVSAVLKELDDNGLTDTTIVFYFGDHGRPHVRDKQWLYDGGIRVPLLIRWPGHIQAGAVNDDLISAIDVAPTCLSLAGITPPAHLQGTVFLGSHATQRDAVIAARDRTGETIDRIRCVRDKRFKYIRNFMPEKPYTQFSGYKTQQYPALAVLHVLHRQGELTPQQALFMADRRPSEELYDLMADPHELSNLANDPAYQDIRTRYRTILEQWMTQTGDQGAIPEDAQRLEKERESKEQAHRQWLAKNGLPPDASWPQLLAFWEKKLLDSKNKEQR
jgi:uncharacterized sulfatase